MEALGVLALVCNITQLVEQGVTLTRLYSQISENGSTADVQRLNELSQLTEEIDKSCSRSLQPRPLNVLEQQVEECASKSLKNAKDLHDIVRKIQYSDGKAKKERNPASKLLRSVRSRSQVQFLQKEFSDLQLMLQTSLLVSMREHILRCDDEQALKIAELDENVRKMLDGDCRCASKAMDAVARTQDLLSKQIIDAESSIKRKIDSAQARTEQHFEQIISTDQQRAAVERISKSLYFEGMQERENMIQARIFDYGKTTSCLLSDQRHVNAWDWRVEKQRDQMHQSRSILMSWLRSGSGKFYISGKPGAGKSSLMSFLRQSLPEDGPAHQDLARWASPKSPVVLSFFFYKPATNRLMKCFEGLWRSLSYQILDEEPEVLARIVLDERCPRKLRNALDPARSFTLSWTNNELKSFFIYLLSKGDKKYLVMLDGLDEFQEYGGGDHGHQTLLDCISEILSVSNKVKFLVSARPDEPFRNELKSCPTVRLHDVNFQDILFFSQQCLKGTIAGGYAKRIASRADGVFLWAHLVANDLARAAKRNASQEELSKRFDSCPGEMNELFSQMLARQDDYFKKQSGPFFQLVDFCVRRELHISLFEILLATRPLDELVIKMKSGFDPAFLAELEHRAEGFEEEILSRSAGLVQITDYDPARSMVLEALPDTTSMRALLDREVTYIHTTAQDYLAEEGRWFLESYLLSETETVHMLGAVLIGWLCLSSRLNTKCFKWWEWQRALSHSLNYIDRFMEAAAHRQTLFAMMKMQIELLDRQQVAPDNILYNPLSPGEPFRSALLALNLPRGILIAVDIACCGQNHEFYEGIFKHYVSPQFKACETQLRDLAVAYTFCLLCDHVYYKLDLLLFDLLDLTSYAVQPCGALRMGHNKSKRLICGQSLWQHFIGWIFPRLVSRDESDLAVELAKAFVKRKAPLEATVGSISLLESGSGNVFAFPAVAVCLDLANIQQISEYARFGENLIIVQRWAPDVLAAKGRYTGNSVVRYCKPWRCRWLDIPIHLQAAFALELYGAGPQCAYIIERVPGLKRERWYEGCAALLNTNLDLFSDREISRLKGAWTFYGGRVCHLTRYTPAEWSHTTRSKPWGNRPCSTCGAPGDSHQQDERSFSVGGIEIPRLAVN